MRLPSLTALAVAVACLCLAAPAGAITNGTADGQDHPNVGGLVSPTQYSDGTWIYCSGTLISPTVFLTAAHCGEDGERVEVTFDTAYQDGDKVYAGTFQADPLYGQRQSDPHDIAVVVLDKPVRGIAPAQLPDAGALDALPADRGAGPPRSGTARSRSRMGRAATSTSTTTSATRRPARSTP